MCMLLSIALTHSNSIEFNCRCDLDSMNPHRFYDSIGLVHLDFCGCVSLPRLLLALPRPLVEYFARFLSVYDLADLAMRYDGGVDVAELGRG